MAAGKRKKQRLPPEQRRAIQTAKAAIAKAVRAAAAILSPPRKTAITAVHEGNVALVASILAEDPSQLDLKNYRGNTPLSLAISLKHDAVIACLLEHGADVNAVNNNGMTPLMLAAQHSPALVERLLALGATKSVCWRSQRKRIASEFAARCGFSETSEMLQRLQQEYAARERALLQEEIDSSDRPDRHAICPVCDCKVRQRPSLFHIFKKVEMARAAEAEAGGGTGAEGSGLNSYVAQFVGLPAARDLLGPAYHSVNDMKYMSKEISETMGVVNPLFRHFPLATPPSTTPLTATAATATTAASPGPVSPVSEAGGSGDGWHIVDLCSGKSLTAALLSRHMPGAVITAVDKMSTNALPHYTTMGSNVRYREQNVMAPNFLGKMGEYLGAVRRPTVLIGMHLCGNLSVQAIRLALHVSLVRGLILAPCCLPKRPRDGHLDHIFKVPSEQQYPNWVKHLQAEAQTLAAGSARVHLAYDTNIKSPRNAVLVLDKGHQE